MDAEFTFFFSDALLFLSKLTKMEQLSSVHWASNSLIISTVICMCKPRRIHVQQILCVMPWAWNIHTGRQPSLFQNPTHTFWMFDRSTCNIVLFDLSADIGNPRCYCVVVLDNLLPTPLSINCWTTQSLFQEPLWKTDRAAEDDIKNFDFYVPSGSCGAAVRWSLAYEKR